MRSAIVAKLCKTVGGIFVPQKTMHPSTCYLIDLGVGLALDSVMNASAGSNMQKRESSARYDHDMKHPWKQVPQATPGSLFLTQSQTSKFWLDLLEVKKNSLRIIT